MKSTVFACLAALATSSPLLAQDQIYRCGTEYTADSARAKRDKCKSVSELASKNKPKPSTQEEPLSTMERARELYPELRGLDDVSVVRALHQAMYADLPIEQVARALNVTMPAPFVPKKLGFIDRWRYESCQTDAAKAPTPLGVNTGLRICKERFGQ